MAIKYCISQHSYLTQGLHIRYTAGKYELRPKVQELYNVTRNNSRPLYRHKSSNTSNVWQLETTSYGSLLNCSLLYKPLTQNYLPKTNTMLVKLNYSYQSIELVLWLNYIVLKQHKLLSKGQLYRNYKTKSILSHLWVVWSSYRWSCSCSASALSPVLNIINMSNQHQLYKAYSRGQLWLYYK